MNERIRVQSRPSRRLAFIFAIIAAVIIVAGLYFVLSPSPKPAVGFSHCDWLKSEISSNEIGGLQVVVKNFSEEDDYDNVSIQISTKNSDITISYGDETLSQVNGEFCLTHSIGEPLRRREESKKYTFDVEVEFRPDTFSKEVGVVARVLANGDVMDEKTLRLRIVAEG